MMAKFSTVEGANILHLQNVNACTVGKGVNSCWGLQRLDLQRNRLVFLSPQMNKSHQPPTSLLDRLSREALDKYFLWYGKKAGKVSWPNICENKNRTSRKFEHK